MDRTLSLTLFALALTCLCGSALLALSGFIDWLIHGRWPDQSVLRLATDAGIFRMRWLLVHDWLVPVGDVLRRLPAAIAAIALAPVCWWLGARFARR